jgi:large subunit ribosomal protein L25
MRENGYVPGVYYNAKGENVPISAPYVPLRKVYEEASTSNLVDLEIEEGGNVSTKPVLIWDIQFHPVKNLIRHVDFFGADLTKEVSVDVPVEVTGTPKGEEEGGMVDIYRESISVDCLPGNIPDSIVLDVSDLDINENINIEDIKLPEGVKANYDENFAIVGISVPTTYEEELEAAEEEGAEEEMEEGEEPESEA